MYDSQALEVELCTAPSSWTNPIWIAGFATYAVGSLCNAAALSMAPAALLAPLDGLTLVVNTFLAPLFLPETLRRGDIVGSVVIVVGVAVCVMFGPRNEEEWTAPQMAELWGNEGILIWTAVCLCGVLATYKFIQYQLAAYDQLALWDPESGEKISLQLARAVPLAMSHCFIAATFGAFNGLFTAATFILLGQSLSGNNAFTITADCISSAFLQCGMFILANITMEYWKQKALSSFDSLFVVPVFQVMLVMMLVMTTGIYYEDFQEMGSGAILFFAVGVVVTCVGVAILSMQAPQGPTEETEIERQLLAASQRVSTMSDREEPKLRGTAFQSCEADALQDADLEAFNNEELLLACKALLKQRDKAVEALVLMEDHVCDTDSIGTPEQVLQNHNPRMSSIGTVLAMGRLLTVKHQRAAMCRRRINKFRTTVGNAVDDIQEAGMQEAELFTGQAPGQEQGSLQNILRISYTKNKGVSQTLNLPGSLNPGRRLQSQTDIGFRQHLWTE